MSNKIEKNRIRWKCRRGMLELDILLLDFFEKWFDQLTPQEKKLFDELLDQPDVVLYDSIFSYHPLPKYEKLLIKLRR